MTYSVTRQNSRSASGRARSANRPIARTPRRRSSGRGNHLKHTHEPPVDLEQQIEERKQSTLHLLLKVARLTNEYALSQARTALGEPGGVAAIGAAHLALFPHIPWQGIRLTELAVRVGTTKQAVGQLVDDLEGAGTVLRVPDPIDRRAKRIVFTAQGKAQILQGLDLLKNVQVQFEQALGIDVITSLRQPLLELLTFLQLPAPDVSTEVSTSK